MNLFTDATEDIASNETDLENNNTTHTIKHLVSQINTQYQLIGLVHI